MRPRAPLHVESRRRRRAPALAEPVYDEFPLACPACGEENPSDFPACWSCHADLEGAVASSPLPPAPPSDQPAPTRPAGDRVVRTELGVALLVYALPYAISGIAGRLRGSVEPETLEDEAYRCLYAFGEVALILFLLWRGGGSWQAVAGLGRPRVGVELAWALVLCAGWFFLNTAVGMLASLAGWVPTYVDWIYRPRTPGETGLVSFGLLVAAASEELFYRAYLWNRLTRLTRRPLLALLVSAGLFALVHPYGAWESLSLFLGGAAFGAIFWVERSLWRLILAHWFYNLLLTLGEPPVPY